MGISFSNSIFVVDSHTAGQRSRIVMGGLPKLQGDSVAEKRDYVRNKKEYLRTFLCNEPRGHNVEAAILTNSGNIAVDFGVFFFSADGYD